jgi:hypothetical protein
MKTRHLIISLVLALLLTLVTFTGALAEPPKPSSFYGTVKITGANVPVGTAVTAWCGGVKYATSPYLYDDDIDDIDYGNTVYTFNVPGDDPSTTGVVEGCIQGQTIIFKVGIYTADQTGVWHGSTNIRLNLTVSNPTAAPVTISGDAGIAGVTIAYTGGSTTTNASGIYSFTVDAGWTGAVIPSLTGYTFNPANRTYVNVMDNQSNQNYFATLAVGTPPPLPSSFYGTVKSNGANIPIGIQVSARINDVPYAISHYTLYQGDTVYSLDVPGDDPGTPGVIEGGIAGDTVVFFVGSKQADQTATWQTGTNIYLNLTVELPNYRLLFLPLIFH